MAYRLKTLIVFLLLQCSKAEIIIDGISMSTALECYRPCELNEPPKICYYHFTLEYYAVLGFACQLCTSNSTNHFTADCQCVLTDGVEKGILTANRMIPGPSVQVCKNDKVVIDVENLIEGADVSIHWHGVWQVGTPYSDGVPFVTQCPIHGGNTFRYQFFAQNPGTHFWHSHSGLSKLDGLCGTLVIREAKAADVSGNLYDHDLAEHVIILNDWMHHYSIENLPGHISYDVGQMADSILINGKGQTIHPRTGCLTHSSLEAFYVNSGKKYRFRLINALATVCPASFAIENHTLTVIAADGGAVEPMVVDSITSFSGERYDFILEANENQGSFWIQVKGLLECELKSVHQLAILSYNKHKVERPLSPRPSYYHHLKIGKVLNPFETWKCRNGEAVCVNQLKSKKNVQDLHQQKADMQIILPFKTHKLNLVDYYAPEKYLNALIPPTAVLFNLEISGIAFQFPPSPLLSQLDDVPDEVLCNGTHKPPKCEHSLTCTCVHRYSVPLNSTVEIVLLDIHGNANLSHPFHLHGGVFEVLAADSFLEESAPALTAKRFQQLEQKGLIKRNYDLPPYKDTIAVPYKGYVILRSKFTNPGFWFMHCHFLYHIPTGMNFIIQVGTDEEIPAVPKGFPKCENFKFDVDRDFMKIF